jgi:hypothetical protein
MLMKNKIVFHIIFYTMENVLAYCIGIVDFIVVFMLHTVKSLKRMLNKTKSCLQRTFNNVTM